MVVYISCMVAVFSIIVMMLYMNDIKHLIIGFLLIILLFGIFGKIDESTKNNVAKDNDDRYKTIFVTRDSMFVTAINDTFHIQETIKIK